MNMNSGQFHTYKSLFPVRRNQTTSDPDDNKFMECAIASNSEIIISGDKHLLKVSGYQGITVLKPREFVDSYLK